MLGAVVIEGGSASAMTKALAALFILAAASARAQAPDSCTWSAERKAIAGRVVHQSSGKPVSGVVVLMQLPDTASGRVASATHRVALDSLGRFCFGALEPAAYRIRPHVLGGRIAPIELKLAPDDSIRYVTFIRERYRLSSEDRAQRDSALADLAFQRHRWKRLRPTRYRLRVDVECFCFGGPPPTFEVVGDSVVAIHGASGPRQGVLETWTTHTVERLFDALEAELRDDERLVTGISYDRRYGFPTRYDTNTRLGMTDSWFNVRVRFTRLAGWR
jgi:hypothetical protein